MRRRRSSYDGNVVVDVDDELAARAPIFSPFFPFLSFYSISSPRGGKKISSGSASERTREKERERKRRGRERERESERARERARERAGEKEK